jgi:molecular chaperone DnaK
MNRLAAVGVDLGTTFSSISIVGEQGQPEIIPNAESERLTPSVVFFAEDTVIVGQMARDALTTDPDQVLMFVKRQMGNAHWHYSYKGQRLGPEDVSAWILKKLKQDAEQYLGRKLPYAVITVPAYFDDVRRRATMNAGEIAGFHVLDLVNEPTAAAIAFGVDHGQGAETVMVYDLGGGTFDATIMRVEDSKNIRIIATDGDHQLGGKDFDDVLMKYAVTQFQEEHGFDPTTDPYVAGELRAQAEKAKHQLSQRSRTMMVLRGQGKMSRVMIARDQFASLIKPKLDTTLTLIRSVLHDAGLQAQDIDRVLLIGGSTRIPAVRDMLEGYFDQAPDDSVNPDEAVSLGAAMMAAKKVLDVKPDSVPTPVVEQVGGLQITDVTSHSLGIEAYVPGTQQRINSILIPRNSPIPVEVSKEFVTTKPGQTAIKVTIYQGESQDPILCNPIGDFFLRGLPSSRPVGCKVRVTVVCSGAGVVDVTAVDIETGRRTTTQVSYKIGQSRQAVSAKARWMEQQPVI